MEADEESPTKLNIYLPPKINSLHTFCRSDSYAESSCDVNNVQNADIEDKLQVGFAYFEKEEFVRGREIFQSIMDVSIVAKYYLSIMLYDGLGGAENHETALKFIKEVITECTLQHKVLLHCAHYNIGRAYYEGYGVKQSDEEAERWWLLSANDGKSDGCVKAQSILAMFYSRDGEDTFDLQKAHYWHQEATGNGSLESQMALGIMYELGMGVPKSKKNAFKCFKEAAQRGSVYAMGNLAMSYYQNKMFKNACDVAKRVGLLQDTALLARQTDCLEAYIKKGIAMGCFIYGRCIFKGVEDSFEPSEARRWYKRAAEFDLDVAQQMQDLVVEGKI